MRSFSLLLGLGSLAGLMMAGWRAPSKQTMRYVDAGIFALLIALVISRGVYVAVNWGYYAAQPLEIFEVWLGGLSGIGALAGGVLAVFILAIGWKFPPGALADCLFPLAGSLSITAWLGCWQGGCAYGLPSTAWWSLLGKDEWGVMAARMPIQLWGASATLLITWLIDGLGRRLKITGLPAGLELIGLGSVIFGLSYLRADPTPVWFGLRLEAWGAVGLITLSAVFVVVLLVHSKRKTSPISASRIQ
jgi:phosphatidylglycerol:prolipoprotein diacylglycerol transferase